MLLVVAAALAAEQTLESNDETVIVATRRGASFRGVRLAARNEPIATSRRNSPSPTANGGDAVVGFLGK